MILGGAVSAVSSSWQQQPTDQPTQRTPAHPVPTADPCMQMSSRIGISDWQLQHLLTTNSFENTSLTEIHTLCRNHFKLTEWWFLDLLTSLRSRIWTVYHQSNEVRTVKNHVSQPQFRGLWTRSRSEPVKLALFCLITTSTRLYMKHLDCSELLPNKVLDHCSALYMGTPT